MCSSCRSYLVTSATSLMRWLISEIMMVTLKVGKWHLGHHTEDHTPNRQIYIHLILTVCCDSPDVGSPLTWAIGPAKKTTLTTQTKTRNLWYCHFFMLFFTWCTALHSNFCPFVSGIQITLTLAMSCCWLYYLLVFRQKFSNLNLQDGWGYDFRANMSVAWQDYGDYATDVFTKEAVRIIKVKNIFWMAQW